jgi:hypothetical protein
MLSVVLQRSPSKSTRKAAAQLRMSRPLVQRLLKSDLNLYPYKMAVLSKLTVQNKHQRIAFAEWAQNEVSLNNVFLMKHTSTWIVWLMYKMCDFGRQRIHV